MGSDAKVDMRPSSVWLREKTAKWPWKTHLRVGAKRDEALEILSSEGTLLVLCSLVDNMPYVVAEAAVRRPFLPSTNTLVLVLSSCGHAMWPDPSRHQLLIPIDVASKVSHITKMGPACRRWHQSSRNFLSSVVEWFATFTSPCLALTSPLC